MADDFTRDQGQPALPAPQVFSVAEPPQRFAKDAQTQGEEGSLSRSHDRYTRKACVLPRMKGCNMKANCLKLDQSRIRKLGCSKRKVLLCLLVLTNVAGALGATRYVWQSNPNPAAPYTNWATAAVIIQEAVDAADTGDLILVTNGIYASGGRSVHGLMTNRVAVTKPVTVLSINGPAVTIIEGHQLSGTTNGNGAIRCAYLTNGATLSGFTLTNGATRTSGDSIKERSGGGVWGESLSATVTNCMVSGNSAASTGGGAYHGTIIGCTLNGNSARDGGGARQSTLYQCTVNGNTAEEGGGVYRGTLNGCTVNGNSARRGGGVELGTLNNCTVSGNWSYHGGGALDCALTNCVVYFNAAPSGANYYGGTLDYCCTTPLPSSGAGNFDSNPQLASASHLSAESPCVGAGLATGVSGTDIDGEFWRDPPSVGCDEYRSGSVTGSVSVAILAAHTNVAVGFNVELVALIAGRVSASCWDFGDGTILSNRIYASHAWSTTGDFPVALRAYNESHPDGLMATVMVQVVSQPMHCVALESASPAWPYISWETAATNIQDAVDAAGIPGALILVSNGVYRSGGRAVHGAMTNRVAVTKPVIVQSVNGAATTVIEGYQLSGTVNGDGAIRCVYLTNGATLSGFTLTRGATRTFGDSIKEQSGGGVWCQSASATVINCVLSSNSACYGGGGYSGVWNTSTLNGNRAESYGGGAEYATLTNCTLTGNSAPHGGGSYRGALYHCTLSGNSARNGGGANESTLGNCTLTSNCADLGGGTYAGTLNNCTLNGNSATNSGGGAYTGSLNNCVLSGNSSIQGGGVSAGTLNNCTLVGNTASVNGGGVSDGVLTNCIVFFNVALFGANYSGGTLSHCCAAPLPSAGAGNFDSDPQLASASRLSAGSPCIGAGLAAAVSGKDIDGESWANPPSVGCDENRSGSVTGSVSVAILNSVTNAAVGFNVKLVALIAGPVNASCWDFGDGTIISNQVYVSHAWNTTGEFPVVLRAYNESSPDGMTATVMVQVVTQPVHYVALDNPAPISPYTSWATAATNIQDAVDAATTAGALVLVSNGVYRTGGRAVDGIMTNRVAVTEPLIVQSVNGPTVTVIEGYQLQTSGTRNGDGAIRCVYLAEGATLSGFTLTKGATRTAGNMFKEQSGGGVWCQSLNVSVTNCTVSANSAYLGAGAYAGTLDRCTLSWNDAMYRGGGASGSIVNHSNLKDNYANRGGGANQAILNQCRLNGNIATTSGGGAYSSVLNHCAVQTNASFTGGGAHLSTLNNCLLSANLATIDGGGAHSCTLNNCTVSGNEAYEAGGGVHSSQLTNSIVYYNIVQYNNSGTNSSHELSTFDHCCTVPLPAGLGNFVDQPGFVDRTAGNFQLQSNSPCINTGINASAADATDLGGNPRISGGTVDLGAYEFQFLDPFHTWLQQFGLAADGSADDKDGDGDGLNNRQEWRCLTNPTNSLSLLRLLEPLPAGGNVIVQWQSVAGVSYFLERSTNGTPSFLFVPLATSIFGQQDMTSYTDTNAVNQPMLFYRVGVND